MSMTRSCRSFALLSVLLAGCGRTPNKPAVNDVEVKPEQRVPVDSGKRTTETKAFSDLFSGIASEAPGSLEPQVIEEAPAPRKIEFPYPDTAFMAVVKANGDRVPATGRKLTEALEKLGDFVQLPVDFSAVAMGSGLTQPRVVITQRVSLADVRANRPNLSGRLYLAANTAFDAASGKPHVTSIEFISWNSRRLKFDFGVIEHMGERPEVKIVDGVRCFTCHKNRGPILGVSPWSNTAHNERVTLAATKKFESISKGTFLPNNFSMSDGLKLLASQAPEVDQGVRMGADFLTDRAIIRALKKSPVGRDAIITMLVAISQPGELQKIDGAAAKLMDSSDLRRFMEESLAIRRAIAPNRLSDIDPDSLMGLPKGGKPRPNVWTTIRFEEIIQFDDMRAAGHHNFSARHVPSNPKAFIKQPVPWVFHPSEVVGATMLFRSLGLTDGDRSFMANALSEAAEAAGRYTTWPATPAEIARRVFSGPQFKDVWNASEMPDRDEFKERFVTGLIEVLPQIGFTGEFQIKRERFTNAPRREASDAGSTEVEALPTTACLRCHDVLTPGRPLEFNAIPNLAFDPFDKAGREAWLRATPDRTRRMAVLARMLNRVGRERDMPPSDSTEYDMFRVKEPASFDAVTEFLEAELKKARSY